MKGIIALVTLSLLAFSVSAKNSALRDHEPGHDCDKQCTVSGGGNGDVVIKLTSKISMVYLKGKNIIAIINDDTKIAILYYATTKWFVMINIDTGAVIISNVDTGASFLFVTTIQYDKTGDFYDYLFIVSVEIEGNASNVTGNPNNSAFSFNINELFKELSVKGGDAWDFGSLVTLKNQADLAKALEISFKNVFELYIQALVNGVINVANGIGALVVCVLEIKFKILIYIVNAIITFKLQIIEGIITAIVDAFTTGTISFEMIYNAIRVSRLYSSFETALNAIRTGESSVTELATTIGKVQYYITIWRNKAGNYCFEITSALSAGIVIYYNRALNSFVLYSIGAKIAIVFTGLLGFFHIFNCDSGAAISVFAITGLASFKAASSKIAALFSAGGLLGALDELAIVGKGILNISQTFSFRAFIQSLCNGTEFRSFIPGLAAHLKTEFSAYGRYLAGKAYSSSVFLAVFFGDLGQELQIILQIFGSLTAIGCFFTVYIAQVIVSAITAAIQFKLELIKAVLSQLSKPFKSLTDAGHFKFSTSVEVSAGVSVQ